MNRTARPSHIEKQASILDTFSKEALQSLMNDVASFGKIEKSNPYLEEAVKAGFVDPYGYIKDTSFYNALFHVLIVEER